MQQGDTAGVDEQVVVVVASARTKELSRGGQSRPEDPGTAAAAVSDVSGVCRLRWRFQTILGCLAVV